MVTGRSAETSGELADERAVRTFLERAAPIILESRALEGERFEAVMRLAEECGLTREQLSCELRFLELRGVISSAPWHRLDVPEEGLAGLSGSAALIPAPPVPDGPEAKTTEKRVDRSPGASPAPPVPPQPRAGPPPHPARSADVPVSLAPAEPFPVDADSRLRELIQQLVVRFGGLTPKVLQRIETEGAAWGLSPEQITAALMTVATYQPPENPPPSAAPAAPDTQLPSRPSPAESFRRWVKQKLAGYPSVVLADDDEQGLIGVGVHRYHLAEVLATHIVRDMVTEQEMRLARDLDAASCHSTVGASSQASSDDQKLREFFEQVAPILSQHRGINPQSRVLLNAVAEQLGLSDEELDRAIRALQGSAPGPDENDPRQLERRESFRSYLRRALAQLPNGIITFRTHQRLCEAGEHFHGVALQWIKPTINEVAGEIGARFISQEQAIEHISALVQDVLAKSTFIEGETRARIYAEGTRWGLDPIAIESILREHLEQVRLTFAAEKRLTRGILILTSLASALVIGGVLWLFVLQPHLVGEPVTPERPEVTRETKTDAPPAGADGRSPAWWDEELRIAAVHARIAHPGLKAALEQTRVPDAALRGDAYQQIVSWYLQHLGDRQDRRDMQSLFTQWYAREPSDEAARQIPETLLQPALAWDTALPDDVQAISAAFWGCRATVQIWKDAATNEQRATELATLLQATVGLLPDRALAIDQLADQYVATLARRYYAALSRIAAEDPARTGRLYRMLTAESADSLDDATLRRLDAELLAVLLPAAGERWEDFADIVRRTMQTDDSFVVLKMLDLFRNVAADPVLRDYLAGFFFQRLRTLPGSLTADEMIEAIRKSVGVTAKEQNLERWQSLAMRAEELLTRKRVDRTNPDVVLQETVDLTYLATQACALASGEEGNATFQEIETAGPPRLDVGDGPWRTKSDEPFMAPYPVASGAVIRQHIERLAGVRKASERIVLLRMIANSADTVSDIDPDIGQKLAEYLLQFKPEEEEHRQMLAHLPRLARWNALRLGLADQLAADAGRDAQRQDVLRAVLGEEVNLSSEEDRDRVRRQLLQMVSATLADVEGTDDKRAKVFDQGRQTLQAFYGIQAKLLRVPAETDAGPQDPSSLLSALTEHVAGQLDSSKLSADEQRLVQTLPHQFLAADFLADNGLQAVVLRQRIWLQTLGAYLAQRIPDKALAARAIVAETRANAAAQEGVFEEMREFESGLLRLWLLYRVESEAASPASKAV
ncbi:MAG: hypothetical protein ACYC6N_02930 [Pirellulaceae bacterium]